MMRGTFLANPPNVPVIQVVMAFNHAVLNPYFILDTGFSGDLQVNPKTAQELGLAHVGVESVKIADGSTVQTPVALSIASLEGNTAVATVLISNGSQLAGIGLLTKLGYKATVDCKYRTVELERVP